VFQVELVDYKTAAEVEKMRAAAAAAQGLPVVMRRPKQAPRPPLRPVQPAVTAKTKKGPIEREVYSLALHKPSL
jgi:FKBP-type peptidyl-prolyl cis-trans isomerase FkpA